MRSRRSRRDRAGLALVLLALTAGCGGSGISAAQHEAEDSLNQALADLDDYLAHGTSRQAAVDQYAAAYADHVYRHEEDGPVDLGLAFVGQAEDPSDMFSPRNVYVRGCVAVTATDGEVMATPEECPDAVQDLGLDRYNPTFPEVDLHAESWNSSPLRAGQHARGTRSASFATTVETMPPTSRHSS